MFVLISHGGFLGNYLIKWKILVHSEKLIGWQMTLGKYASKCVCARGFGTDYVLSARLTYYFSNRYRLVLYNVIPYNTIGMTSSCRFFII